MSQGLIVRSSNIHAAGCYTTRRIRKGQRVCEYTGPRMSKEAADQRYADRHVTYLFGYGDRNMVIDGFGAAMFMNHCCNPNCETEEQDERIFVVALRDIEAGEELVYEYNLYDSDDATQDCYCGAPNCRGTMFAPAEVERRAKLKKASKRRRK
jgi:SET domain-containing protein